MKVRKMNDSMKARSFRFIISKDRLDYNLESLISKILNIKKRSHRNSVTPLLISLNINYNDSRVELHHLKRFLKKLKAIQSRFFVRFITDLWWAEESTHPEHFYTFDGNVRDLCDTSWTVSVINNGYLEIITKFYKPNDSHVHIYNKSKKLKSLLSGIEVPKTPGDIDEFMSNIYRLLLDDNDVRDIDNNFHLMLITDKNKDGVSFFHSIPILAMNYLDAQRRYIASYKNTVEICVKYPSIFPVNNIPNPETLFVTLLSQIKDNENLPDKIKRRSLTYSLGEMLLSYFIENIDDFDDLSRHDLIMLDIPDEATGIVVSTMVSMDDLALDKHTK